MFSFDFKDKFDVLRVEKQLSALLAKKILSREDVQGFFACTNRVVGVYRRVEASLPEGCYSCLHKVVSLLPAQQRLFRDVCYYNVDISSADSFKTDADNLTRHPLFVIPFICNNRRLQHAWISRRVANAVNGAPTGVFPERIYEAVVSDDATDLCEEGRFACGSSQFHWLLGNQPWLKAGFHVTRPALRFVCRHLEQKSLYVDDPKDFVMLASLARPPEFRWNPRGALAMFNELIERDGLVEGFLPLYNSSLLDVFDLQDLVEYLSRDAEGEAAWSNAASLEQFVLCLKEHGVAMLSEADKQHLADLQAHPAIYEIFVSYQQKLASQPLDGDIPAEGKEAWEMPNIAILFLVVCDMLKWLRIKNDLAPVLGPILRDELHWTDEDWSLYLQAIFIEPDVDLPGLEDASRFPPYFHALSATKLPNLLGWTYISLQSDERQRHARELCEAIRAIQHDLHVHELTSDADDYRD